MNRTETRRQRYDKKQATIMPVSVATINFGKEANLAYVIRAAVCFGTESVFVVGNTSLSRDILNDLSGSAFDYVSLKKLSYPTDLIQHCKDNNIQIVSIELPEDCGLYGNKVKSIYNYKFDFSKKYCLVVGHETQGVPVEILLNSDIVYIPLQGKGWCLNTSQAANVVLYEASKQYALDNK